MEYDDKLVEAIEEGRIVKVPEFYAIQEGLTILRKPSLTIQDETPQTISSQPTYPQPVKEDLKTPYDYRKAASNWRDKQVISELLENWNWLIRIERRKRELSRKQFAKLLGEEEETIKMLEYGVLPKADFILINKMQETLKINLRKDQKDYSKSVKELLVPPEDNSENNDTSGRDEWRDNQGREDGKSNQQTRHSSNRVGRQPSSSLTGSDIEILEDEI